MDIHTDSWKDMWMGKQAYQYTKIVMKETAGIFIDFP